MQAAPEHPTIVIRQAALADLDLIVPLFDQYRQFYKHASDLDGARAFLRERFNHGESVIFIALDEGAGFGFAQMYPLFSSGSMARKFLLNDLFVAESGRKRGIGKALLDAAADYGRARAQPTRKSHDLAKLTTCSTSDENGSSLGFGTGRPQRARCCARLPIT